VLKRFLLRSVVFVGLVVPASFGLALLASPAYPAPAQAGGCFSTVQQALAAAQARVQHPGSADDARRCSLNQLYFFELVKARAVMASCEHGPERDRTLVRLDADVEHINQDIAATCR
jgi:hypothetical protein